jgi:GDP-L-fucose synthase
LNKDSKIIVFGGTGMLGSAIVRRLQTQGYQNILTPSRKNGLDLTIKETVDEYIQQNKPDYVFMVAGLVGGILANNTRQAEFLYNNALMILHVLEALKNYAPDAKVLYTGSTCIYPKENPQPIKEDRFMKGPLEETNKGYAVAKGMGIVACELYKRQYGINSVCAMPSNLYGPNDNYDPESSHFIASLVRKFLNAKNNGEPLVFWGTGNPRREALYVDDGEIEWDLSKPDGIFEKRVDISKLKSIMPGYNPRSFKQGLKDVLAIDFGVEVR